jgi:hypothetical protein
MPGTPHVSVWLSRTLIESLLIVVSIMGALALDEWQEDREIQELVDRSVASFAHELQQNHDRVEAVRPYHEGLHRILERRIGDGGVSSINEFRNIMEALQPAVLLASAWQTAVATGVLSRMNYELVSALSLTYSTQFRFDEVSRNGNSALLAPMNLAQDRLEVSLANATRFVADITMSEMELMAYYQQTLELIEEYKRVHDLDDEVR